MYMQQRYCDSVLGIFLGVGPVTTYEQPLFVFNRYRYANSNPCKFADLDRRFGFVGAVIGGVIEVGVQMVVEFFVPDNSDVAVATAVGAVAGGIGGRLATSAAKGTIRTVTAV